MCELLHNCGAYKLHSNRHVRV
jgi:hypothetical protein